MGFRTLLDIRTDVRDEVGEPLEFEGSRAGYWTKGELNRRINRALNEVTRSAYSNETTYERPIEPREQVYATPPQLLPGGTAYMEYRSTDETIYPLRYREHKLLRSWGKDTFDVPRFWSIWRNCYYLWPIPPGEVGRVGLDIEVEDQLVYIALPSGDRILLYAMPAYSSQGTTALALTIASGSVRLVLPDESTLVIAPTAETGTPSIILENFIVSVLMPSGDTLALYNTGMEAGHGNLRVRYYGMVEPLVEDGDGCELHDTYHDAVVHRVAYWLLTAEDAVRRQDHLLAFKELMLEINLDYRTRQMQQPADMHFENEYLGDFDGRGLFKE